MYSVAVLSLTFERSSSLSQHRLATVTEIWCMYIEVSGGLRDLDDQDRIGSGRGGGGI